MSHEPPTIDPMLWSHAGGDLLTAVYGYVPTLHDARLIEVSLKRDSAMLRFAYTDLAEGAARSLGTRFELLFGRVNLVRLPLDDPWVLHAALSAKGNGLRLDLQTGGGGWIIVEAERLEIHLLDIDVPTDDTPPTLQWKP